MGIAGIKSKIKIIAAVAAALIFAICALPFLVDADRFRPQIESRLSAELGRDVRLGKVRLALFSGKLSVDDISVMDDPEFSESPFVTARSLYIGIKLKPLIFSKKVQITEISLDQPSIYLRRSDEDGWNISLLGAAIGAGIGAGIGVETDTSTGSSEQVSDIRIGRLRITNGRVEIIEAGKKSTTYEKVTLTVNNLSRAAAVPFNLTAATQGEGMLELNGTFGPLDRNDTFMTPLEAIFKITHFDPVASGSVPSGAGFSGLFDFSGTLNSDGGAAQSKGTASVVNLLLFNGGAPAGKPVSLDYALHYDLINKTGALTDATVGFGQSAMRLGGNFDASGDVTNIKMALKGSGVPLDELQEFLPSFGITLPNGAALEGGTLDTEIAAEGFLNNLVMDGRFEITGTRLTGFDLGDKIAPIAGFAGMKTSMDGQIEKLYASMRWTADGITVNNIQLVLPDIGEMSGSGTISPLQELDLAMRLTVRHNALTAFTKGDPIEVGFFIRGAAADPEFIPDYKDAARVLIDALLTGKGSGAAPANKLMDSLKGLLGNK